MHHKPFDSCAVPRPTEGAYSAPTDTLAGLKLWALGSVGMRMEREGEKGEGGKGKDSKQKREYRMGKGMGRKNWVVK